VLYDIRIVHEYTDVLHRRRFGFDSDSVAALVEYIETEGEFVPCEPASVEFSDEDDRPFFEVALTGEADFLVAGNRDHFPRIPVVKTPRGFLDEYFNRSET
jgi:predicted nucleic acid-binding protein